VKVEITSSPGNAFVFRLAVIEFVILRWRRLIIEQVEDPGYRAARRNGYQAGSVARPHRRRCARLQRFVQRPGEAGHTPGQMKYGWVPLKRTERGRWPRYLPFTTYARNRKKDQAGPGPPIE
jgi:hypothetical protein